MFLFRSFELVVCSFSLSYPVSLKTFSNGDWLVVNIAVTIQNLVKLSWRWGFDAASCSFLFLYCPEGRICFYSTHETLLYHVKPSLSRYWPLSMEENCCLILLLRILMNNKRGESTARTCKFCKVWNPKLCQLKFILRRSQYWIDRWVDAGTGYVRQLLELELIG